MEEYDIERLRNELIDYYGTASMIYLAAWADLMKVKNASDEEILQIALADGYNLDNYKKNYERKL